MLDEKAQLHTLEAMAAATMLLLVIIYAIDATSMTPLTSSTANVHVETELQLLGQDILSSLDYAEPGYSSELKNFIASWNGEQYIWNGKNYIYPQNNCTLSPDNTSIVDILNKTLVTKGIAHNIELTFLETQDNSTGLKSKLLIYNGEPSNNAVIISRKIVLQGIDIDLNSNENEDCGSDDDNPNSTRPIKDIDPSTNLYNIVDVKLILWRM
jgi:hypothetical protein